jgi:hypothetical protein
MQIRLILLGLLVAQLADAATFTLGWAMHGISLESNGFAVALYNWAGLPGVLAAKGTVIVIALALLAANAQRYPRLLIWGSATATSFGVLGVLANVVSLAMLAG